MATVIHSGLWKAALLSTESTYFPRMVVAAAFAAGRTPSQEMVQWAAASDVVLSQLVLSENEGMDAVLAGVVSSGDGGVMLDAAIRVAIASYEDPAVPDVEVTE